MALYMALKQIYTFCWIIQYTYITVSNINEPPLQLFHFMLPSVCLRILISFHTHKYWHFLFFI